MVGITRMYIDVLEKCATLTILYTMSRSIVCTVLETRNGWPNVSQL